MKRIPLNIWVANIDSLWNIIGDYQFASLFYSDDEFIQLVYDAISSDINNESSVHDYIFSWVFRDEVNGAPNRYDVPINYINELTHYVCQYYEWISTWDTYIIDILSTYEECTFTMVDKNIVIVRC